MNDLVKRKKEMDEEFDEIIEMESDLINVKSNMTISTVGKLLEKFNEVAGDLIEIINKKENYDTKLKDAIESAIGQVADKFSQIQPPTINVSPQLKFDIQPLQNIAGKISEQNNSIINLLGKFNTGQNEQLYKLLLSVVEKQNNFLDREFKQINNTTELKEISEGVNKNNRVSKLLVVRGEGNLIIEVVPIYEQKNKK